MNDFDRQLGAAVQDDGLDRTGRPALAAARAGWTRRRNRRRAGATAFASLVLVGAGAGVVAFNQGATDERIVTDVATTDVDVATSTTGVDTIAPATTESDPSVPSTVEVNDSAPTEASPTTVLAPDSTPPPDSTPLTDIRGLDIANGFVDNTFVLDVENRTEIRDAGGSLLWDFEHCAEGETCASVVQTVLDGIVWLLVHEFTGDQPGTPTASALYRIPVDGGEARVVARSEPGSYYLAGQPAVGGFLLATATSTGSGNDPAVVTITADDGAVTTVTETANAVELSADGRFLATTSWSLPDGYGRVDLIVTDLADGRTNALGLGLVTAAPIEWSRDGESLVVRDTWEDPVSFVVDPWGGDVEIRSVRDVTAGEQVCLVDDDTVAIGTWNAPYAEGITATGAVELRRIDGGEVVGTLDVDVYAVAMACHRDGTVTLAQVPVVDLDVDADGSVVWSEPDRDSAVAIIGVNTDGSTDDIELGEVTLSDIA